MIFNKIKSPIQFYHLKINGEIKFSSPSLPIRFIYQTDSAPYVYRPVLRITLARDGDDIFECCNISLESTIYEIVADFRSGTHIVSVAPQMKMGSSRPLISAQKPHFLDDLLSNILVPTPQKPLKLTYRFLATDKRPEYIHVLSGIINTIVVCKDISKDELPFFMPWAVLRDYQQTDKTYQAFSLKDYGKQKYHSTTPENVLKCALNAGAKLPITIEELK